MLIKPEIMFFFFFLTQNDWKNLSELFIFRFCFSKLITCLIQKTYCFIYTFICTLYPQFVLFKKKKKIIARKDLDFLKEFIYKHFHLRIQYPESYSVSKRRQNKKWILLKIVYFIKKGFLLPEILGILLCTKWNLF